MARQIRLRPDHRHESFASGSPRCLSMLDDGEPRVLIAAARFGARAVIDASTWMSLSNRTRSRKSARRSQSAAGRSTVNRNARTLAIRIILAHPRAIAGSTESADRTARARKLDGFDVSRCDEPHDAHRPAWPSSIFSPRSRPCMAAGHALRAAACSSSGAYHRPPASLARSGIPRWSQWLCPDST